MNMKRIAILVIAGLVLSAPGERAIGGQRFGAAPDEPSVYCWIEQIHFTSSWYNANGKCQEFNKRAASNEVYVPWSAVGRYDAATRETFESIRIVKGGLDIPTHYYYGTIESHLVCPRDPWLQKTSDCGVDRITTTETIPQYYVDSLVRNRRRPFTSDLTPEQRASVSKDYQAAMQPPHVVAATPVGAGNARSAVQQAIIVQILAPQPGASIRQGDVRVQVRAPMTVAATQPMDVEVSWLPPRPSDPSSHAPPPAVRTKTWQAPADRLSQGVVLPRDVTTAWLGPTLLRVRLAGAAPGAWSEGVSFNLTSGAIDAARLPAAVGAVGAGAHATPDWSAAAQRSNPPTGAASPTSRVVQPPQPGFGGSASQAPPSSLGTRP
jgi:hypothetical protein